MPFQGRILRPFVLIAWVGVATTAINTLIPVLGDFIEPLTAQTLRTLRDLVLFVHAVATLLPMLALALLAFRTAPFAAMTAAAFTGIEKAIELIGQTLSLFPPEEMVAAVPIRDVIAAIWDQLYFTLWFCNTLGATAAGWLMLRSVGEPWRWLAATGAWLAALLTLLLLLGQDYVRLPVPSIPAWLFFPIFVAYRLGIAMTLRRASQTQVPGTHRLDTLFVLIDDDTASGPCVEDPLSCLRRALGGR